ncbi:hypothetical protein Btru_073809, partial [Bulinus truncatus]
MYDLILSKSYMYDLILRKSYMFDLILSKSYMYDLIFYFNLEWTCKNMQRIALTQRCDGIVHCTDESDEVDCGDRDKVCDFVELNNPMIKPANAGIIRAQHSLNIEILDVYGGGVGIEEVWKRDVRFGSDPIDRYLTIFRSSDNNVEEWRKTNILINNEQEHFQIIFQARSDRNTVHVGIDNIFIDNCSQCCYDDPSFLYDKTSCLNISLNDINLCFEWNVSSSCCSTCYEELHLVSPTQQCQMKFKENSLWRMHCIKGNCTSHTSLAKLSDDCFFGDDPLLDAVDLPGHNYSFEKQCSLMIQDNSTFYRDSMSNASSICSSMYCAVPGSEICEPFVAASGTSCGQNMICRKGKCQYSKLIDTDSNFINFVIGVVIWIFFSIILLDTLIKLAKNEKFKENIAECLYEDAGGDVSFIPLGQLVGHASTEEEHYVYPDGVNEFLPYNDCSNELSDASE